MTPCACFRPDHNGECLLCDEPLSEHTPEAIAAGEQAERGRQHPRVLCLHSWSIIERLTHGEIDAADPRAHTAVIALGCIYCHTVDLFPGENAALLTPRYVARLRELLAHQGWVLPADIVWGPRR